MKKNLLYLWALICSVSLLTACSSDDDNTVNDETTPPEEEAVVTAPDVVGTYWGNLDISIPPRGPRSVLCVVVVVTCAYGIGLS